MVANTAGAAAGRRGRAHPQDIDRHIAARIRERRLTLGLTQQQLAELIGVTCQQAHKYEAGLNRLSAGRLHAIARALGVGVAYFFAGLERPPPAAPTPGQRRMLELARHFVGLPRRQQEVLCELARALAGTGGGDEPEPEEGKQAAA